MSHSLGEVESLARRAARGAGMTWGLAEEAGHATAWLCAHDLPGMESLAELLKRNETRQFSDAYPVIGEGIWHAQKGALCPIAAGSALSDRAQDIAQKQKLCLRQCDEILLLVPFVAEISQRVGRALAMRIGGGTGYFSAQGVRLPNGEPWPDKPPVDVELLPASWDHGGLLKKGHRATVTEAALNTLSCFADRLYAPETEARRRTGAG